MIESESPAVKPQSGELVVILLVIKAVFWGVVAILEFAGIPMGMGLYAVFVLGANLLAAMSLLLMCVFSVAKDRSRWAKGLVALGMLASAGFHGLVGIVCAIDLLH